MRPVGGNVLGGAEPDEVVQEVVPRVVEVHVVVGDAEVRIEGDSDQSPIARVLGRKVGKWCRQQYAVLDDLDLSGAFQDEDATVRRDLEATRAVEAVADDQRRLEVPGRCGRQGS